VLESTSLKEDIDIMQFLKFPRYKKIFYVIIVLQNQ